MYITINSTDNSTNTQQAQKRSSKSNINQVDPGNNPARIVFTSINGYDIELPPDTMVKIDGQKVIENNAILGGVSVYDHVKRGPYTVDFECTLTQMQNNRYLFPQAKLITLWDRLFMPNESLWIENTYLNGLGVYELIVSEMEIGTSQGAMKLSLTIKAHENEINYSLIIQQFQYP